MGNGSNEAQWCSKATRNKRYLILGFMQSKGAKQNIGITKHHVTSKHARTMKHKNNETPCHGKAYKNIKAQEHQSIGVVR